MKELKNKRGKQIGCRKLMVLWLATCMLLLGGCGSSSKGETAAMDMMTNGSAAMYSTESAVAGGSFYSPQVPMEYDAGAMEEAKEVEIDSQIAMTDRKLIKTVSMDVETQEFEMLMSTVEEQVKALGGYIENMNTYNGNSYYGYRGSRNADLTIRIPKEKLDGFLENVSGISNVIRRSDNVEDITLTYVDLESHRNALRTEQDRLLELLERAETIEDIITIEQRISNLRYQLESMESQLRTFDNQVNYSTVYLNINEVEIFTPVEKETVWQRITGGFADSLKNIGEGFTEFGIWFVIKLPYMVIWAVIIVVFLFLFKFVRRHMKKKAMKIQNNQEKINTQTIIGQPLQNMEESNK